MNDRDQNQEEIFSRVLRAGRRTYFFDVRATKADDYYLTITESKKHSNHDGNAFYRKHKIYLYKEDFDAFKDLFNEVCDFIIQERGADVISENEPEGDFQEENRSSGTSTKQFTDLNFDDI